MDQVTISCRSSTAPLREALVKHPRDAFRSQAQLEASWKSLGFLACPDFSQACSQYDAFAELLQSLGVGLRFLPSDDATDLDSLYTHDPSTAIGDTLVGCLMGKPNRRGEMGAVRRALIGPGAARRAIAGHDAAQSAPAGHTPAASWAEIAEPGRLEGGDLVWLDPETVAVGVGFRTNQVGIRQLCALTGVAAIEVPLPWWNGPADCLHLMSLISPLADDLALVYRPLLPVLFVEELGRLGIQLVDVPAEEYESLGCNVLAVSPRVCVAVDGNPVTVQRMRDAGCEVHTFPGSEICVKGLGGPTCLTRPLVRD